MVLSSHPVDKDCNVCQDIRAASTYDVANPKPKLHISETVLLSEE
jgi:hypothetical protein